MKRDSSDAVKQEAWDTCNSMVISWILGSVNEPIKKSIMFLNNSSEIWRQLEKRYAVTNGSRKYKLSKEIYETKQGDKSVTDYYTEMRGLWEELESLSNLPPITTMTPEINAFIKALNEQQEEQKLFQLLNGLDEGYQVQRSHLLMMSPLPSVDVACSYLHQEESQKEILKPVKEENEVIAMLSKSTDNTCAECGKVGHTKEKCWRIIGYPSRNPKAQRDGKERMRDTWNNTRGGRWNRGGRFSRGGRSAAHVKSNVEGGSSTSGTTFTAQQLEQLMKLLPTPSKACGSDTEEEMDYSYAGMVSCNLADAVKEGWIIDSGASDHMSGCLNMLQNTTKVSKEQKINLPTGETTVISHTGDAQLRNEMQLKNVLYIPSFKHNLLSVQKLTSDGGCKVNFYPKFCIIEE